MSSVAERDVHQVNDVASPEASPVQAARAFGVMIAGSVALHTVTGLSVASIAKAARARRRPHPLPIVGAAGGATYVALRRRMLRWGATDDEVQKELLGDELVRGAPVASTRAVTIDAPVKDVWPWLAQIGQDRGGFYSYEWLENLAGCRMRNADRVHPEWQHRELGDIVRMHWAFGMPVARFEPNRALVLEGWGAFVLEPLDQRHTRLIARGHRKPGLAGLWDLLLIELPHFLMERKMLLGIKTRAEQRAQGSPCVLTIIGQQKGSKRSKSGLNNRAQFTGRRLSEAHE
jgi:hypothetical protein